MTVISSTSATLTPQGYKRTPTIPDVGELRREAGGWRVGEQTLADPLGPDDIARLRAWRGLRVRWPYKEGRQEAMGLITALAAAGVPLTAEAVPPWAERADPGLADLLRSWPEPTPARGEVVPEEPGAERSTADLRREEHSVRLRRHAWRSHVADAPVTVIMASRRPHYVRGALAQIARQRNVELQLVLALHGFTADLVRPAIQEFPHPITVLEADASTVFGDVLAQAAAHADADLIAKWDDDDWYGPEHLADLLMTRLYSGADVVGTAAEFFYLAPLDVTVRRTDYSSEVWSDHVAGGTILIGRSTLAEAGGFQPLPKGVDSALLKAVHAGGGRIYRTHGLGYMLRRSGADEHTWRLPLAHFLRVAANQWRGFRPSRIMEAV
ncbi:family 2 glycosyl transferase [Thermopolyspora sp. NPDC052614]|uniref:family 2 glycosyl transferase n=1 Tax=Thermopolyspora sp. NPDC052614 TaxID=3155682 RepID=UPI00344230E7